MTDIKGAADRIRGRLGGQGKLTVLTGAGISAESGVPTFRDMRGLWERHDIMQVASPEGFANDPELVHRFYNERRGKLGSVSPNPGHTALVSSSTSSVDASRSSLRTSTTCTSAPARSSPGTCTASCSKCGASRGAPHSRTIATLALQTRA